MTYRVARCLACEGTDLRFRPAVVAPFIASHVFRKPPAVCRLAECGICGLVFFEDRFDSQEVAILYANYRSEAYWKARHYWEPWYTARFNAECGGQREMVMRREIYARTLRDHAPDDAIGTVLDYGGDRGQLMIGGPGRAYHAFDISGVEAEPGVIRIGDAASLGDRTFDLVLLCEVLEHASDPARILRDVASHVRPGGLLYVTVPSREFRSADIPAGPRYSAYLRLLLRSRWATMAADFWSTSFRVKFRRIPPLGFAKMHEHVTFFSAPSLVVILQQAGLTVLTSRLTQDHRGLVALCQRPSQDG